MTEQIKDDDETIDPSETKSDRFKRVATRRLRAALKQMQLLSNCANTISYEYTEYQVNTLFEHVDKAVEKLKASFDTDKSKNEDDLPSL